MPNDGQNPGAGIAAGKIADRTECAQEGVLDHILGVGSVAGEPARQPVSIIEVRHHRGVEACVVITIDGPADAVVLPLDTRTNGIVPWMRGTFSRHGTLLGVTIVNATRGGS